MPLAFIFEVSVGGSYFLYFSDGVLALAFCFGYMKLIKLQSRIMVLYVNPPINLMWLNFFILFLFTVNGKQLENHKKGRPCTKNGTHKYTWNIPLCLSYKKRSVL